MTTLHLIPAGLEDEARLTAAVKDDGGRWKNSYALDLKPHIEMLREVLKDLRNYARLRVVSGESPELVRALFTGSGFLSEVFEDEEARESFLSECMVYDKIKRTPEGATRQFDSDLAKRTLGDFSDALARDHNERVRAEAANAGGAGDGESDDSGRMSIDGLNANNNAANANNAAAAPVEQPGVGSRVVCFGVKTADMFVGTSSLEAALIESLTSKN